MIGIKSGSRWRCQSDASSCAVYVVVKRYLFCQNRSSSSFGSSPAWYARSSGCSVMWCELVGSVGCCPFCSSGSAGSITVGLVQAADVESDIALVGRLWAAIMFIIAIGVGMAVAVSAAISLWMFAILKCCMAISWRALGSSSSILRSHRCLSWRRLYSAGRSSVGGGSCRGGRLEVAAGIVGVTICVVVRPVGLVVVFTGDGGRVESAACAFASVFRS